jgi:hypothetical protein
MMATYWFPALAIANSTGQHGWVFGLGFLIMGAITVLAARLLIIYTPGSYGASLVGETARTYFAFAYLGVFAGLGFGLVSLGLATGVAVAIAGALAVAGLVGYVRWLKPWLTARNLRPLAFLDDEAA